MNNPELINIYVSRLLKEIEELVKNRLLVETQLQYTEGMNKTLSDRVAELESQLEKQNKRINKTKEADTF